MYSVLANNKIEELRLKWHLEHQGQKARTNTPRQYVIVRSLAINGFVDQSDLWRTGNQSISQPIFYPNNWHEPYVKRTLICIVLPQTTSVNLQFSIRLRVNLFHSVKIAVKIKQLHKYKLRRIRTRLSGTERGFCCSVILNYFLFFINERNFRRENGQLVYQVQVFVRIKQFVKYQKHAYQSPTEFTQKEVIHPWNGHFYISVSPEMFLL